MTEIERMALMFAKAIKTKETEGNTIKLTSGEIVSVESGHTAAKVKVGDAEIRALNKSKDKLSIGESVWLAYTKSLADAVIFYKAGLSSLGVGEDMGNGNERFNDYEHNTLSLQNQNSKYNTIKGTYNRLDDKNKAPWANEINGRNNALVNACNYDFVSGDSNYIISSSYVLVEGSRNGAMLCYNSTINGKDNYVMGSGHSVNGERNEVGFLSMQSGFKAYFDSNYRSNAENNPAYPPFTAQGGDNCSVAGQENVVCYNSSAQGYKNLAYDNSSVCGYENVAIDESAAFGFNCKAVGRSMAIGIDNAAGTMYQGNAWTDFSNAYLRYQIACSAASGNNDLAVGEENCCVGYDNAAIGYGLYNQSADSIATGTYNLMSAETAHATNKRLVVGNGTSSSRADAFVVDGVGEVYAQGSYNTIGADYAEYFEWLDGNPDNEDRAGLFVTLEGDKIRLANDDDDYILGVVSATPSITGNADIGSWRGRYKQDIFGRNQMAFAETKHSVIDENGEKITVTEKTLTPVESDDYDSSKEYIPRALRREYDAVGMLGQLVVTDDGSCKVNGYCRPNKSGTATCTFSISGYRVIGRIDQNHVKIIFR